MGHLYKELHESHKNNMDLCGIPIKNMDFNQENVERCQMYYNNHNSDVYIANARVVHGTHNNLCSLEPNDLTSSTYSVE